MEKLIPAALAPILACVVYIYIRDKYEKEPLRLLILGLLFGAVSTFPIIQAENLITALLPITGKIGEALFLSFAVAAFTEETMKFILLFFLTWRNDNLNERFDGIVYAAFISLGFAGLENVLYVLNPELGGMQTAVMRAVFSVPAHALFGVTMGYYFSMAKLERHKRVSMMIKGFVVPILIHGVYDFILLSEMPQVMFVFVPFVVMMWISGFKKMKKHILASPFRYSRRRNRNIPQNG